jgi:trimethylamine--corrinoid protein Co-methyltransferase
VRTIRHFALAFAQPSKHVRTGVLHAGQVPWIIALARAATGKEEFRPIFSVVDCTISPLMHDGPMTEACIELARLRVPILIYPMPLAGGTAPATLAGTVLVHNVEFLSGLVLYQVVQPGTPVIYGTGASQLDMRSGRYGNTAHRHWLALALREMARFYDLPVNLNGLSTASGELDALYGYEASTACLLAYLAGADEIYSIGLLGSAQVLSLDKMVLDNHLAHQVELMVRSVPADEEHLQAGVIARVGSGGSFLSQRETRDLVRREYVPVWPPGGTSLLELAHAEACDILQRHVPPGLPDGAIAEMEAVVAAADQELAPTC